MADTVTLAALSFEERCVAAFQSCAETMDLLEARFLDYASVATQGEAAATARAANWDRINSTPASKGVAIERVLSNPYATGPLERLVTNLLNERRELYIDISCMTRPHVLAVAQALARSDSNDWSVGYTLPFSYGDLNSASRFGGWRDTLLIPIGPDPSFSREGEALGILVVGNESTRASIAMAEIEPAAGIAVASFRSDRPDLHRTALAHNASLINHLTRLRMPGPRASSILEFFPHGGWEMEKVSFEHLSAEVARASRKVIMAARTIGAPIVLYPFGPKIVVFLFALLLGRLYPEASWAIYPVARTHPLTYSDGVDRTIWFPGHEIDADLFEQSPV